MKSSSFHILRVGVAITFLWIGILIFKDPLGWVGFIQPWAANILPVSPVEVMIGTAFFDIFVGALLLIDYFTWLAALLGSLHLILVLVVSGINAITVRDIGLLSATIAIFLSSLPKSKVEFLLKFIKK